MLYLVDGKKSGFYGGLKWLGRIYTTMKCFFSGYKKIRDNQINANNLFEIPALFSMMPELKGKRVLDLGCGFGEHCKKIVDCGAEKVVGIDISQKMLEVARAENFDSKIRYIHMPMEEIAQL